MTKTSIMMAIISLTFAVSLSGCAVSALEATNLLEKDYKAEPSEWDARNGSVIIFRESHFVGMAIDAKVKVNEKTFGYVANGSGLAFGLPPGDTNISVSSDMSWGHPLLIPIKIETGKHYYIELAGQSGTYYVRGAIQSAAAYLLSSLKSNADQYCNNEWCAAIEDADAASLKLQKIHLRQR